MCGSAYFGRFLAHHQELTIALAASGFTVRALLVSGLADHDAHHFGPQHIILLPPTQRHILRISVPKITFCVWRIRKTVGTSDVFVMPVGQWGTVRLSFDRLAWRFFC